MTWNGLVERYVKYSINWHQYEKEGETDSLAFVIDNSTLICFEKTGEIIVYYHTKKNADTIDITLAKNKTPEQMDNIIKSLSYKCFI
jgi:hypothetical protein